MKEASVPLNFYEQVTDYELSRMFIEKEGMIQGWTEIPMDGSKSHEELLGSNNGSLIAKLEIHARPDFRAAMDQCSLRTSYPASPSWVGVSIKEKK